MKIFIFAFIVQAMLLGCWADSFQATCVFDDGKADHVGKKSAGRGRAGRGADRRSRAKGDVKGRPTSRPAFYGVKNDLTPVIIRAQAAGGTSIFVNGMSIGENSASTCEKPAEVITSLTGGDVVSFSARGTYGSGPDAGFFGAIFEGSGKTAYTVTGSNGWKGMIQDNAAPGWMLPGYDDSAWPALVSTQWSSDCNADPISDVGGVCTWYSHTFAPIFVRFVVPKSQCSCNEGACPDGTCTGCRFDQGDGRLVCYQDWTEAQCDYAGPGYTWCGQ